MSEDEANAREMQRANQAELLLSNPLWPEVHAALQQQYLNVWKNTKVGDVHARERAWVFYQVAGQIDAHIRAIVGSGRLASAHLRQVTRLSDYAGKQATGAL